MKNILGLDLGTTSIGWALIKVDEDNKPTEIQDMGVRIVPLAENEGDKFTKGQDVTVNADWTKEDCKNFRPALACLLDMLQKRYPKAQIYSLLNSELREPINESMREICKHYNIQLIELHDIDKQNGHPSISGMKSICNQLLEAIK